MVQLNLKSFDFYYLRKAILKLQNLFKLNSIQLHYFPITRKKFTVLSGPHIDKKSRDQFEMKQYKTKIIWNSVSQDNTRGQILYLISILKQSQLPGIELKIHVKWTGYLI